MAGLCEGGNEPAGSLKAVNNPFISPLHCWFKVILLTTTTTTTTPNLWSNGKRDWPQNQVARVRFPVGVRHGHADKKAVNPCCAPVPTCLCVRPSSIHWFHTTIIVAALYEPKCHGMTNLLPGDQPFCPVITHSRADIAPFHVDEAYLY
ncbi:hypothetical protein ANN_18438 [Periplaneta americana]|uniref:Uncharacterized protein n=1 Tax=Periplaneta americana TaxID=6978 RepID=A0ABQ8SNR7_PERAM|nr:hypothetical protein ANN_18438 [Periplaneta americana]